MIALAFFMGCSVAPMESTWLTFVPLDVPQDVGIVFPDDTWVRGDVGTVGGESMVRVAGTEILRSDDRGESWRNVSPTSVFREVAIAGETLIVFEQLGSPFRMHVSPDGGGTWALRTFDVEVGGIRYITADRMAVNDNNFEDVHILHLDTGKVRTHRADRVFMDPMLVAPNGAVVWRTAPTWQPHRAIASFTSQGRARDLPQDARLLRGTGMPLDAEPLLFTTDSRLVVTSGNGRFVSEQPLDVGEDQRAVALSGTNCHLLDAPTAGEEFGQDGILVTNGGTEPIRVLRWQRGSFVVAAEAVEPGANSVFSLDLGRPVLAERADGTCLEYARNLDRDTDIVLGAP